MIAKGGEFLMSPAETGEKSSAKWQTVKLVLLTSTVIIFSIPVALLPFAIRRVQPTAEFVLLVFVPGLWNSVSSWITVPCLYVLLNIVLVTLGVRARAPPISNDDHSHNSAAFNRFSAETESIYSTKPDADAEHSNIILVESKIADPVQNDLRPAVSSAPLQKPATSAPVVERRSRSFKDLMKATMTPAPVLYAKNSILRRSTAKLSNLSRESRERREVIVTESCTPAAPKTSPDPPLVVFEICTDVGDYYMQQHLNLVDEVAMGGSDGESNIMHRLEDEGIALSSEELYVKAESFIGDFYRQLKMQREDSWKRLYGILGRSC